MWTCRPPQTIGCRDERWIVSFAFSHIICEIPDTASYFALFLNSHRSCGTHPLFRWHYLLWEYIEVGTNENTNTGQQAFRTSSLARRNQPGLLSKCWHFEPESNISRNYGFKPFLNGRADGSKSAVILSRQTRCPQKHRGAEGLDE